MAGDEDLLANVSPGMSPQFSFLALDADRRLLLASDGAAGPAPGQGGEFADRFALGEVTASGNVVTMPLSPTEGSYVLSDLSTGPVLFATC